MREVRHLEAGRERVLVPALEATWEAMMDILEFRERVRGRMKAEGVTEETILRLLSNIASDAIEYAGSFTGSILEESRRALKK